MLRGSHSSHCCEDKILLCVSLQFADLWPFTLCCLSGSEEVETTLQPRWASNQATSRVYRAEQEMVLVPLSWNLISEMYGLFCSHSPIESQICSIPNYFDRKAFQKIVSLPPSISCQCYGNCYGYVELKHEIWWFFFLSVQITFPDSPGYEAAL